MRRSGNTQEEASAQQAARLVCVFCLSFYFRSFLLSGLLVQEGLSDRQTDRENVELSQGQFTDKRLETQRHRGESLQREEPNLNKKK